LVALGAIVPAILNLTLTVSDSTVQRLVCGSLALHLLFHHYGIPNSRPAATAGLNWAVFAVRCVSLAHTRATLQVFTLSSHVVVLQRCKFSRSVHMWWFCNVAVFHAQFTCGGSSTLHFLPPGRVWF
jgi:hypothetical protein